MASHDNTYSRLVAWLKILLPLAALVILSTLFLVSRTIDPSQTIPYAELDGEELASEQRIGSPNYSGVSKSGSAINLFAESARPDPVNPKMVSMVKLEARIETADGNLINIIAADGLVDTDAQFVTLDGGVTMTTSDGYRVDTRHMSGKLDATELATDGPIVADGPLGHIEAGDMTITRKPEAVDDGGYLLVFKDGVKLIYTPRQE